ncbi:MAG: methyltransferase domain-containing protein [Bacteroidia bacterium]|nr:methyltransferase domain-containing protein [Bacteroidia bacterium]
MKISWLKHLLSYFFVITVKKIPSKFSKGLCLQLEAGKLLLNTKNANYSYGNLHKVFEIVFNRTNIRNLKIENVLLLGLGTGSVINILQKKYNLIPHFTAIEIDPEIIKLIKYWDNTDFTNTEIICGDAFNEIKKLHKTYDLVIIDLFFDLQMPSEIFDKGFISSIKKLMNNNAVMLINSIALSKQQKLLINEFKVSVFKQFKTIKTHEVLELNTVFEVY